MSESEWIYDQFDSILPGVLLLWQFDGDRVRRVVCQSGTAPSEDEMTRFRDTLFRYIAWRDPKFANADCRQMNDQELRSFGHLRDPYNDQRHKGRVFYGLVID